MRQMLKVHNLLQQHDAHSYIAFTLHDSIIIDFDYKEEHLINEIKSVFEQTELGYMKSNVSTGKTFGDMRKINV